MANNAVVARCARLANATRNSGDKSATGGATSDRSKMPGSPMTGAQLRAQLRAQQGHNNELREAQLLSHQVLRDSDRLDTRPPYRWLVLWPSGDAREICCLPEQTASALVQCYPGARLLPLPDSAAEAGHLINNQIKPTARAGAMDPMTAIEMALPRQLP